VAVCDVSVWHADGHAYTPQIAFDVYRTLDSTVVERLNAHSAAAEDAMTGAQQAPMPLRAVRTST
jgi:hypothetical protein